MLSKRKIRKSKEAGDLDVPVSVSNDFEVTRLGRVEDHLWLLSLRTPITLTAVSTAYLYDLPFSMAVNKVNLYQTTAAGAADDDALNVRVEFLLPNGSPELYYDKEGVVWPSAGTRLVGRSLYPPTVLIVTVDGTATNLLDVSLEVEVMLYG